MGLKYCGGCRAGYDRVGVMKAIQEDLSGVVEFVRFDDERIDAVLVVTGCPSACARIDLPGLESLPVHVVTNPDQARQWAREMKAARQGDLPDRHGTYPRRRM